MEIGKGMCLNGFQHLNVLASHVIHNQVEWSLQINCFFQMILEDPIFMDFIQIITQKLHLVSWSHYCPFRSLELWIYYQT